MNAGIRLVCFDLGGVIVRTCETWEEASRSSGVPYRPRIEELGWRDRLADIEGRWQVGALAPQLYFDEAARLLDGLHSSEEIRRIHHAWLLGEYPGMDRLVLALNRTMNGATACLSNTNPLHWRQLGAPSNATLFPAFHALTHRMASHLEGSAKPSERIYREFEARTGHRGEAILFFDDRAENVEAARRRGWRACLVEDNADHAGRILQALRGEGIEL